MYLVSSSSRKFLTALGFTVLSSSACSAFTNPTSAAVSIGGFSNPGALVQTSYISYTYKGHSFPNSQGVSDQVTAGKSDMISGDSFASLTNTTSHQIILSPAATLPLNVQGNTSLAAATSSAYITLGGTVDSDSCNGAGQTYNTSVTFTATTTVFGPGDNYPVNGTFNVSVNGG